MTWLIIRKSVIKAEPFFNEVDDYIEYKVIYNKSAIIHEYDNKAQAELVAETLNEQYNPEDKYFVVEVPKEFK